MQGGWGISGECRRGCQCGYLWKGRVTNWGEELRLQVVGGGDSSAVSIYLMLQYCCPSEVLLQAVGCGHPVCWQGIRCGDGLGSEGSVS